MKKKITTAGALEASRDSARGRLLVTAWAWGDIDRQLGSDIAEVLGELEAAEAEAYRLTLALADTSSEADQLALEVRERPRLAPAPTAPSLLAGSAEVADEVADEVVGNVVKIGGWRR